MKHKKQTGRSKIPTHLGVDHRPDTSSGPTVELRLVEHVRGGRNVGVRAPGNLGGEVDLTHADDGLQPAAQTSVAGTDLYNVSQRK